jgi:hypothetical protein
MLRILSAHLGPHSAIARLPETSQIAGYLQGTPRRRQQMQDELHPAAGNARRFGAAEHFLQTNSQNRVFPLRVINGDVRSRGNLQMRGRFGIEQFLLRIIELMGQCRVQVDIGKL